MNRLLYGWIAALLVCMSALAEPPGSAVPDGSVSRAQFTTAVEDREPVDQVLVLHEPVRQVYFFTDLRHLEGRTITHRWEFEGQEVAQKSFNVGGPRWRVFSSKTLQPGQYGEWSVTVVDQSGWPLYIDIFNYQAGSAAGDSAAAAESVDTAGTGTPDAGVSAATDALSVTE